MPSMSAGSNAVGMVYRKLVLAIFLLLVLLLIDSGEDVALTETGADRLASAAAARVPAVVRALAHHPPSLRIFRALLQVNLMLWCAALCVRVWSQTLPIQVLGDLLFAPVDDEDGSIYTDGNSGSLTLSRNLYKPVRSEHDGAEDGDADDHGETNAAVEGSPALSGKEEDSEAQGIASPTTPEDEEDLVNVTIGSDQGALLDLGGTNDAGEDNSVLGGGSVEGDDENDEDDAYDPNPNPTIQIPTATAIASAATDMLLQILATLVLFTWTSMGYLGSSTLLSNASPPSVASAISKIAAPTFPLLLFVYSAVVAVTPWKNSRSHMWKLVYRTTMAPCYSVTFRDGFLGDVLTSSVRPMQDVAFTVFYIGGGLQGWWSWPWAGSSIPFASSTSNDGMVPSTADSFLDRADAVVPHLEKSWIYYTVVLPMWFVYIYMNVDLQPCLIFSHHAFTQTVW
jgi:EXS family